MAAGGRPVEVDAEDPQEAGVEVELVEGAGAEGQTEAPDPADASAKSKSVTKPVNRSISVAVATLCQRMLMRAARGLVELSIPLRDMHAELLTDLKSAEGV
eukprot:2580757-Amphidinium_carterae.1